MKNLIASITLVATLTTGCSAAFVQPRTTSPQVVDTACTQSYTLPIVDGIISAAAVGTAVGLVAAASGPSDGTTGGGGTAHAVFLLGVSIPAVLFAMSGIRGAVRVSRCKSGNADAQARTAALRPSQLQPSNGSAFAVAP